MNASAQTPSDEGSAADLNTIAPSQDLRELLIRMQLLERSAEKILAETRQRLREALQPGIPHRQD